MAGLLITASDTDAGKTVLTCALIAYWQRYCQPYRLGVLKPLQSGPGDRERYQRFDLDQSEAELNPIYYPLPLAPPVAARLAGKAVDLAPAWRALVALSQQRDWVLVEGVGGLGSPVTDELTVADLAVSWRLPGVLVIPVRLGAIAQAVANAALARQCGVTLKGIVLNCADPAASERLDQLAPTALIETLTHLPILGVLPHLKDPTAPDELAQAARQLSLEALMPSRFWLSSQL